MIFELQRFYRAKALVFIFLCYAGFALLGIGLVSTSHGNYGMMTFVAILFLAGPLVTAYLLRSRFIRPVSVEITDSYLEIREEAQEAFVVRWADVAAYQVEFTKSLMGSGYALKLMLHDGSKTKIIFYEPVFIGGMISEDSALYQLSRSIKKFNRSAEQPIELQPNFLAGRLATIIATVVGIMVLGIIGLFYLNGGRTSHRNISGLSIIIVILVAGIAGRKKAGDKAYHQLQQLHQE